MVLTELSDHDIWVSHINYELSTLAALPRWVDIYSEHGPATVQHACLEAALMHARLIIEFLAGRPSVKGGSPRVRHSNDVQPDDFLPGWECPNPNRFDDRLAAIDRHLAHLSKARSDGETAPANFLTELVDEILDAFATFTNDLFRGGYAYGPAFQVTINRANVLRWKDESP